MMGLVFIGVESVSDVIEVVDDRIGEIVYGVRFVFGIEYRCD